MPEQYLTDPYLTDPPSAPMVSLLVCQLVLREAGPVSAIRIQDVITVNSWTFANFFVMTFLHSDAPDGNQHILRVVMFDAKRTSVAAGSDYRFVYQHGVDPTAPGAFLLTTEFNLDLTPIEPGVYHIEAWLDGTRVARTPLMLRRLG